MNLGALRRQFSPRRRFLGLHSVSAYQGGRLGWETVLTRAVCTYCCYDFERVPPARRQAALALKVKSAGPFERSRCFSGWVGGRAHVWFWDVAHTAEEGVLVPESALHVPGQGLRLVQCLDGYEGQYWQHSELRAARWWKGIPDASDWIWFQRFAGLRPEASVPDAVRPEWLDRPWARPLGDRSQFLLHHERRMVQAGVALSAFMLSWQAAALGVELSERSASAQAVAMLERSMEPAIRARAEAFAVQEQLSLLAQKFPAHRQIAVMEDVAGLLPHDARLIDWSLDGTALRIAVEQSDPDVGGFVRVFEAHPEFESVTATRGRTRDQLILDMRLSADPASA